MPDHEEAVREARLAMNGAFIDAHKYGRPVKVSNAVDAFESAIRASERAKYAALVEAAENGLRLIASGSYHNGVTDPTGSIDEGEVRAGQIYGALRAALAALQSKEGTN